MIDRIALTIEEAAEALSISKSKMYQVIKQPDCDFAFVLDGRKLISRSKLEAWVDRKVEEANAS